METDKIRKMILSGFNLDPKKDENGPLFRAQSTQCYSSGGLDSPTVIEQFSLQAPDGSEFLVQITKIKQEEND